MDRRKLLISAQEKYNWTYNTRLNRVGEEISAPGYLISDFIEVDTTLPITFEGLRNIWSDPGIITYDSNKRYVDWWGQNLHNRTVGGNPNKQKYVRINTTLDYYENCYISQNGIKIFEGKNYPPQGV